MSRMDPCEYHEEVRCVFDSGEALKLEPKAGGAVFWVPKSVIHEDSEVYQAGGEGNLVVYEWFAIDRGWE